MIETNEYAKVLQILYSRSLILEDMSDFHHAMKFWFFDAIAHLDYSISTLAFNADSPRNLISREYLKYHGDEGKTGDLGKFPGFMGWLKENYPEEYEKFPLFIQKIYDPEDPAAYRSFRIVLNPDERHPLPSDTYRMMIDEMFDKQYLATIYNQSVVAQKFEEYRRTH